jgi:hypothetical protein
MTPGLALLIGGAFLILFTVALARTPSWQGWLLVFTGIGCTMAGDILLGQWWAAVIEAAGIACVFWQHGRKNRKKISNALGARSRALRAALVRKARKPVRPRLVRKPSGARA